MGPYHPQGDSAVKLAVLAPNSAFAARLLYHDWSGRIKRRGFQPSVFHRRSEQVQTRAHGYSVCSESFHLHMLVDIVAPAAIDALPHSAYNVIFLHLFCPPSALNTKMPTKRRSTWKCLSPELLLELPDGRCLSDSVAKAMLPYLVLSLTP